MRYSWLPAKYTDSASWHLCISSLHLLSYCLM